MSDDTFLLASRIVPNSWAGVGRAENADDATPGDAIFLAGLLHLAGEELSRLARYVTTEAAERLSDIGWQAFGLAREVQDLAAQCVRAAPGPYRWGPASNRFPYVDDAGTWWEPGFSEEAFGELDGS